MNNEAYNLKIKGAAMFVNWLMSIWILMQGKARLET